MTERLTKKHDNSIYGNDGCMSGCDTCSWCECRFVHEMIEKLAHYEDLEEQGRLVVLPEGFNLKRLKRVKEVVAERYCPRFFGLNDLGCECGKSMKISDCLECWEHEMKGE